MSSPRVNVGSVSWINCDLMSPCESMPMNIFAAKQ
jgi:hypothetical protein